MQCRPIILLLVRVCLLHSRACTYSTLARMSTLKKRTGSAPPPTATAAAAMTEVRCCVLGLWTREHVATCLQPAAPPSAAWWSTAEFWKHAMLALLSVVIYINSLNGEFVFDDRVAVVENKV